ncbi:urea transporter [Psychrobacillus sp. NPDC058041]|uniref:urea transporter n=1 Tax=Psychrobacillus sp. NPDC058041 TaxID=3346310 RepID=UPI0036DCBD2B
MKEKFIQLMSASVKGISQVVFIENIISGLLILAGIAIYSIPLGLITIGSAITGTLVACICGADKKILKSGLFGFNSVLGGLAIYLFLEGPHKWIIALLCAGVTTIVTAALMNITKHFDMPILTFPYIILTWFFIGTSFRLSFIKPGANILPQNLINWERELDGPLDWHGLITGIGQVFFLDEILPAFFFLIAIFIASRRYGIYAIIGSVIGWLTALFLGGEITLINLGLYNYNAVLTMIAVTSVLEVKHKNAWITGIFASILSVQITASLDTFLLQYGLPVLTMPFVLSTWLIQNARKVFPNI